MYSTLPVFSMQLSSLQMGLLLPRRLHVSAVRGVPSRARRAHLARQIVRPGQVDGGPGGDIGYPDNQGCTSVSVLI